MQKPYLEAGKIVNTHGVRGEVRIQPWADDAAFLLGFRTFYRLYGKRSRNTQSLLLSTRKSHSRFL